MSAEEAAALAGYLNAVQEQRLAELARILETQGADLSGWDGSLSSLDRMWGWAIDVAQTGFAGIQSGLQPSQAIAFGIEYEPSQLGYVSELIDQYVLAVVQKLRPGARWAPVADSRSSDFRRPIIETPDGPVWRRSLQSAGVLERVANGSHVTAQMLDPSRLRTQIESFLAAQDVASDRSGTSILAPLLAFEGQRVEPPRIPPSLGEAARPTGARGEEEVDWNAEAFEVSGKGKNDAEPWRVRALSEKRVMRWLVDHGYTQPDGAAITVDFLRSRDADEEEGTIRDLEHADQSLIATTLSARGRLRGLVIEPRTEDQAARRELLEDLHLLARRARGRVHLVGL